MKKGEVVITIVSVINLMKDHMYQKKKKHTSFWNIYSHNYVQKIITANNQPNQQSLFYFQCSKISCTWLKCWALDVKLVIQEKVRNPRLFIEAMMTLSGSWSLVWRMPMLTETMVEICFSLLGQARIFSILLYFILVIVSTLRPFL